MVDGQVIPFVRVIAVAVWIPGNGGHWNGVCRARRAGAWQAALEPDCSIQSHNDITIWRDNHPLFDNLWALELISIPQHSDSHGLAVENLGGVHLNDPHTLEGRALEIALRGNTTMASNNGEQAFECEDANIYLTPLREGWVGCFCFSHQSAVLIKKSGHRASTEWRLDSERKSCSGPVHPHWFIFRRFRCGCR